MRVQVLGYFSFTKLTFETLYPQENQNGEIGITLISTWFEPYSDTAEDIAAAKRALDFMFGW